MKMNTPLAVPVLGALALTISSAVAVALAFGQYQRIDAITIPGAPLKSFDISWVDEPSQTYFLADRSNAGVDIINSETHAFVGRIVGFVGFTGSNAHSGPDGIEVDHAAHQAWVGDGNSTVKVVDLAPDFHSGTVVDTI